MAKGGFGKFMRTLDKIGKEIERNNKRQARLDAQRQRAAEQEQRRLERELTAQRRQSERELAALQRQEEQKRIAAQREKERLNKARTKAAIQAFLRAGQEALVARCQERTATREALLQEIYL